MYRLKTIAIIASLTLFIPPPQAEARRNQTRAIIGAAIIGAAIASSASRSHRSDRYRDDGQYYSYRRPQYYRQPTYYAPVSRYDSDGCSDNGSSDLYRYNSGVGRDRMGTYFYDTGNMTQYGDRGYPNY